MIEALPKGYTIEEADCSLLVLKLNGERLQKKLQIGRLASVIFPVSRINQAKEYAGRHAALELQAHEEVPNYEY